MVEIATPDIRRERIALPLLRDERPELNARELDRIIAERAGLAADSTSDRGAESGFDVETAEAPGEPIGFGTHGERGPHAMDRGA
jgi:hypothetical protein